MSGNELAPAKESTMSSSRKALSILIVQMGEVEEVFRSLMAMKAVKHLYPQCSIHVLSRAGVSDPFKRVEWIDSVIDAPAIAKEEDPVAKTALWIDRIISKNYDILANWTASPKRARMAALASTLIPSAVKLGDYVSDDLIVRSADAWSMYRNAWAGAEGVEQDIHLTDMVTTQLLTALQIHAGDPDPAAGATAVTSRYFFKPVGGVLPPAWAERPKGYKWIAVHSGSSPEGMNEWIGMVLRRHPDFAVVLLGENHMPELEPNPRVIDLGSDLHFDATISVLAQCGWLVSGAHPIVDLASLLNLRVFYCVDSSTNGGFLKWTESGPYGNGHIVATASGEWQPEAAYAAWSYFQSEWFHKNSLTVSGHFENLGIPGAIRELSVFQSRIRPASEGGGVSYEPVAGPVPEFENWMYRVRGQMARAWFCGWLPPVEEEVARWNLTPGLIQRIRTLGESIEVVGKLANEGRATALSLADSAAKTKAGYLMSVEDRAFIEEAGRKLIEIEELIARVTRVEPGVRCLLKWYRQMVHNLEGRTIAEMAKETASAFDLMSGGVDLVNAYTRRTLDRARPKAVSENARIPKEPGLHS